MSAPYPAHRPITTETKLALPLNGSIFTTTRSVDPRKNTPVIGATMEAELGTAYASSRIISANVVPERNSERQQIIHAIIPAETEQLPSNWEYSTCSIGGREYPSVQRTVILLASEVAHATPEIGSDMPVELGSIFTESGYILADRQVVRSGMELEPVFRVERRNYIIRSTRTIIGDDPLNGKPLYSETTLYYSGEVVTEELTVDKLFADKTNAYWGVQTDGTKRTGDRLSCSWFAITTELVVAGDASAGVVAVDSYADSIDYRWPPVLDYFELLDWTRQDGGVDIYPHFRFKPDGYSGPCDATVTRTWSSTPFTGLYVEVLKPTPIHYGSPFYNLNIPSCLHPETSPQCDIGSGDPIYTPNSGSARDVDATTMVSDGTETEQTTWPDTLRVHDGQRPYRGGYLRTVIEINKPLVSVP